MDICYKYVVLNYRPPATFQINVICLFNYQLDKFYKDYLDYTPGTHFGQIILELMGIMDAGSSTKADSFSSLHYKMLPSAICPGSLKRYIS